MIAYSNLRAEMARHEVTNTQIAASINVNEKTFRNKLRGISDFTWPEVQTIQREFFPNVNLPDLFERKTDNAR